MLPNTKENKLQIEIKDFLIYMIRKIGALTFPLQIFFLENTNKLKEVL